MYNQNVVTGRIIEIHDDRVLTQQGDMVCTYHSRYYTIPDAEMQIQAMCVMDEELIIESNDKSANRN